MADLSDRFHVYAFDLLGHGQSDHVSEADHSIMAAARDLDDVVEYAGAEQVILVGHSMGGQIVLKWCSAHPHAQSKVAGLVLVHTTPQNPFDTMAPVPLQRFLKPLHQLMLQLTPPLSPLVRLMNALNYMNGTTHWSNDFELFGGTSLAPSSSVQRASMLGWARVQSHDL